VTVRDVATERDPGETRAVAPSAGPLAGPGGPLLALQRSAGNRAVVQRLMDVETFKESTSQTLTKRGTAVRYIDEQLKLYHFTYRSELQKEGDPEGAEQMLLQMRAVALRWMTAHSLDGSTEDVIGHDGQKGTGGKPGTSGQVLKDPKRKKRYEGLEGLLQDIAVELATLKRYREKWEKKKREKQIDEEAEKKEAELRRRKRVARSVQQKVSAQRELIVELEKKVEQARRKVRQYEDELEEAEDELRDTLSSTGRRRIREDIRDIEDLLGRWEASLDRREQRLDVAEGELVGLQDELTKAKRSVTRAEGRRVKERKQEARDKRQAVNLLDAELSDESKTDPKFSKVILHYDAPSPRSVLEKIAPAIDMAVPNAGDTLQVEVEVRFPVEPSGIAFVGGRFSLNIQRDSMTGAMSGSQGDENIAARAELAITAGAQLSDLARAQIELGGFFEASARTGKDVMALVSYGIYRRWRESAIIPDGWANVLWGGQNSDFGRMKAEHWSREMEKRLFDGGKGDDNENYVASGGLIGAKGKVGVSGKKGLGAELSGSLSYNRGTKYDRESIKAGKGEVGAQNKKSSTATITNRQERLGRVFNRLTAEFGWAVGPLSGNVGVAIAWLAAQEMNKVQLDRDLEAFELAGSVTGKVPIGFAGGDMVVKYLAPAAAGLIRIIRRLVGYFQGQKGKGEKGRAAGIAADLASDVAPVYAERLGEGLNEKLADGWDKLVPKSLSESKEATKEFKIGGELERGATVGLTLAVGGDFVSKGISVQLSLDKELALEIPGFLDVSVKKTARVFKLNWGAESGAWKFEGIE
jgi:hypothetical protein